MWTKKNRRVDLPRKSEEHAAWQALVKDQTAALDRQKPLTLSLLKRKIDAIDAEMERPCKRTGGFVARLEILISIPRIGH